MLLRKVERQQVLGQLFTQAVGNCQLSTVVQEERAHDLLET